MRPRCDHDRPAYRPTPPLVPAKRGCGPMTWDAQDLAIGYPIPAAYKYCCPVMKLGGRPRDARHATVAQMGTIRAGALASVASPHQGKFLRHIGKHLGVLLVR